MSDAANALQTPVNAAISAARDLPTLVAGLKGADPALAEQLEGKSLAASKSAWGGVAVLLLTSLSAHYNLGWTGDTIALLAGGVVLIGLRMATSAPIVRFWPKSTTNQGTNP